MIVFGCWSKELERKAHKGQEPEHASDEEEEAREIAEAGS